MNFKELNLQIKNGTLRKVYVLTGSEEYLKDFYLKRIKDQIVEENLALFNLNEFEGAKISADGLVEALGSYPFMAEKKLVVLKNTAVFTRSYKNSEIKKTLMECISDMPDFLYLVFVEESMEKTSELYKLLEKYLSVVELDFLKTQDLIAWITKQVGLRKKQITSEAVLYLIEKCDNSLYAIMRELDKLANYLGDTDTIKKEHIDSIVTKSLESRIFDLVDSLIAGNKNLALQILIDLKELKEPNVKISSIISQHFINLAFTKLQLSGNVPTSEIIKKMKKRDFVIRKYTQQLRTMDMKFLEQTIEKCSIMDLQLKTSGNEDGFYALEQFIFSY